MERQKLCPACLPVTVQELHAPRMSVAPDDVIFVIPNDEVAEHPWLHGSKPSEHGIPLTEMTACVK
jgi:hypothetical protein